MWTASLLMFPLLLAQAIRVRKLAMRLPVGHPPNTGQQGEGEAEFSIVGLGDSVIAGVGVAKMADSLTARIAGEFHRVSGKTVAWEARGENGARLAELLSDLKQVSLPKADLIIVSIGVNDVSGLTGLIRWQMQVMALVTVLGNRQQVVLLGVPPMEFFHALPQPLRWVLGLRAALLDKTLQQVGDVLKNVTWVDTGMKFDAAHLAVDGYHPNERACVEIAGQIVNAVLIRK